MTVDREKALSNLLEVLGTDAELGIGKDGHLTLTCAPASLRRLVQTLKSDPNLQFVRLVDVTAMDQSGRGITSRFKVVYHLHSFLLNEWLRIKVPIEADAEMPSISDLYPAANWYEREVFDMFGIRFSGHPNLQRLLMPDDWVGHPLRKDYPLGAERIPFTHHLVTEDEHV